MPRTTPTAVQGILLQDYNVANSLSPFVESASAFIDQCVTVAAARGTPLPSTLQEILERWVSAHIYVMVDQAYAQKSTGGASASFQGQTGMVFEATKYGQTALMLDTTGTLTVMSKRQVAGVDWLGTNSPTSFWNRI